MHKNLFNKTHFVLRSNMANTHGFFDECLSCEVTKQILFKVKSCTSSIHDSLEKYFACLFGFRRDTFITLQ